VGCGTVRDKRALLRLALDDADVVCDPDATRPGRGAYVCDAACAERAVARRAFGRAFKRAVSIPGDLVESVGKWQKSV
jgi:predicted RNA-binding protein YlxR (DUF448 family)